MEEKKLLELIEQFIAYGKKKLALNEIDALAAKNYLYAEFDIYPSDDVNISFFSEDVNYYVDEFYNAFAQLGLSENDISLEQLQRNETGIWRRKQGCSDPAQ